MFSENYKGFEIKIVKSAVSALYCTEVKNGAKFFWEGTQSSFTEAHAHARNVVDEASCKTHA
jgi:hypothetical protein